MNYTEMNETIVVNPLSILPSIESGPSSAANSPLAAMRGSQPPTAVGTTLSSIGLSDARLHTLRPSLKRMRSEAPTTASESAQQHKKQQIQPKQQQPQQEQENHHIDSQASSKRSRDALFDSVVANNNDNTSSELIRVIKSPDDLGKAELLKCFEILHACGKATVPDATLATTRKSIEGFLDAIFNGWRNEQEVELIRPPLEFAVEAEVVAGQICAFPWEHDTVQKCLSSEICKQAPVSAIATYSTHPPLLKIEFALPDPASSLAEEGEGGGAGRIPYRPITGIDEMRWLAEAEWISTLRLDLRRKILNRLHKNNKHIALWKARKLVQGWIKGGEGGAGGSDLCASGVGFMGTKEADAALMGLGWAT